MGRRNKGYRLATALAEAEAKAVVPGTLPIGLWWGTPAPPAERATLAQQIVAARRVTVACRRQQKAAATRERQIENARLRQHAARLRTIIRGGTLRPTAEEHETRRRLEKAGLVLPGRNR